MHRISKFEAIKPSGERYVDFRKTLNPKFKVVWRDIALGYLALFFLMSMSFSLEYLLVNHYWTLIPIFSLIIGLIIAYLHLFCHEAIHMNIHPKKKQNDTLANIFLFLLSAKDIETCRKRHWQHHFDFGTVNDPENVYFYPLSIKLFFKILSGMYFVREILIPRIIEMKNYKLSISNDKRMLMLLAGLGLHLAVLFFCYKYSFWQTGLIWLLSITIFFPLFSVVRQILEHRSKWADEKVDYSSVDHGKVSRIFKKGFLSNIFGGAGFNRILLHQWDPNISYTRFDDMEEFLKECPQCRVEIHRSKTSYFEAFLWLIR